MEKVFGIGMSRTGTTTLGKCFEILGLNPHIGFDRKLKALLEKNPDNLKPMFKVADRYRSFEDSPWYVIYKQLDKRYPGSKFIMTIRKDSETQAKSTWRLGVESGVRQGPCPKEYIEQKTKIYEAHVADVKEYFKDRPQDLLVICWEDGDGWEKICPFLNLPVPSVPVPHANKARKNPLVNAIRNSSPVQLIRAARRSFYRSVNL